MVPNSHYAYRVWKQSKKASLQLAISARDPSIRQLMLRELEKFQRRVDECHSTSDGMQLLESLNERKATRDKELADHLQEFSQQFSNKRLRSESSQPAENAEQVMLDTENAHLHGASQCPSQKDHDSMLSESPKDKDDNWDEDMGHGPKSRKDISGHGANEHGTDAVHQENDAGNPNTETGASALPPAVPEGELSGPEEQDEDDEILPWSPSDRGDTVDPGSVHHDEEDDDLSAQRSTFDEEEASLGEDSDNDDPKAVDAMRRMPKKEAEEFKKDQEWQNLIDDEQPDDETREKYSLLSMEAGKIWTEEDLDTQHGLELGLLLLYNLSRGSKTFHLTRSIHVKYTDLPKDAGRKFLEVTKAEKAQIKKTVRRG